MEIEVSYKKLQSEGKSEGKSKLIKQMQKSEDF
jgi:hypothetical protein